MTFGNHFSTMTMGIGGGQWWYSNFSTVQQQNAGTTNNNQQLRNRFIWLIKHSNHRRNDFVGLTMKNE
jgi:hypothetical protein